MNIFMTTIFVNITNIMILRQRYKLEEKRKKKTEMEIARKMPLKKKRMRENELTTKRRTTRMFHWAMKSGPKST